MAASRENAKNTPNAAVAPTLDFSLSLMLAIELSTQLKTEDDVSGEYNDTQAHEPLLQYPLSPQKVLQKLFIEIRTNLASGSYVVKYR